MTPENCILFREKNSYPPTYDHYSNLDKQETNRSFKVV